MGAYPAARNHPAWRNQPEMKSIPAGRWGETMQPVGRRIAAVLLYLVTLLAVQTAPASDITPQSVTVVLPELDRLVEQTLKKTGVPGLAVAVVCKDQVFHLKGFGVREAGKAEPVD